MPLLLLIRSLKWTVNWYRETKYSHGNAKSRQLFSMSSIWERKAKLTCLIKHFQITANWQRSLKRKLKTLLDWKLQNFKAKWTFKKTPHLSTMKWECSSCWSQNIPCFCGWSPGLETYSRDSSEKSRTKPRSQIVTRKLGKY